MPILKIKADNDQYWSPIWLLVHHYYELYYILNRKYNSCGTACVQLQALWCDIETTMIWFRYGSLGNVITSHDAFYYKEENQ